MPPIVRKRKSKEIIDKENIEVDRIKRAIEVLVITHRYLDIKKIIL